MTLNQLGDFTDWNREDITSLLNQILAELHPKSFVTVAEAHPLLKSLEAVASFLLAYELVEKCHNLSFSVMQHSEENIRNSLLCLAVACKRAGLDQPHSKSPQKCKKGHVKGEVRSLQRLVQIYKELKAHPDNSGQKDKEKKTGCEQGENLFRDGPEVPGET